MQKCKNYILEAGEGIEPSHSGFADRCLTTWLTRHNKKEVKRIQAFLERLVSLSVRGRAGKQPRWESNPHYKIEMSMQLILSTFFLVVSPGLEPGLPP